MPANPEANMTDPTENSEPVLLEETSGAVRILTLNRPSKKNALSSDLLRALIERFAAAAADDDVRVIGLTGAGDAFCSGADLTRSNRASGESPGRPITEDEVVRLVTGIRVDCEKPVIAGIGGIAIGGGLALAMCADMRIASAKARVHPGYARAGTSPDCGLSWTLPQAIGHERAMRFLLEPKMMDADAALALGLVGEVVPAEEFEEAFLAYCRKIAEVAPLASRQTKRLVTRAGILADLEDHLRDELKLARRALSSEDGREAVKAIFQKRKPEFTGR
jgi:2-(1,2-epoxy-1,2-dihydrophenyl)acetyl-CoA isomerase